MSFSFTYLDKPLMLKYNHTDRAPEEALSLPSSTLYDPARSVSDPRKHLRRSSTYDQLVRPQRRLAQHKLGDQVALDGSYIRLQDFLRIGAPVAEVRRISG